MDSQEESCLVILVKLRASNEVSAVQEGKAIAASIILCGVMV